MLVSQAIGSGLNSALRVNSSSTPPLNEVTSGLVSGIGEAIVKMGVKSMLALLIKATVFYLEKDQEEKEENRDRNDGREPSWWSGVFTSILMDTAEEYRECPGEERAG